MAQSIANPALIMLHGGPGLSETSLFRYFNGLLERSFTVIYWDQRGAGKSYRGDIPRSSMNVEQFISDLDEPAKFNAEMEKLVRPILPPNPPASTA